VIDTILSNYIKKVSEFKLSEALLAFDYLITRSNIQEADLDRLVKLHRSLNNLYVILEVKVDDNLFSDKSLSFILERRGEFISKYCNKRAEYIESSFPHIVELIDNLKLTI